MIAVETFPSIDQASGSLTEQTRYFGGGTLLMRTLNYGQHDFDRLVRSTDPALKQISNQGSSVSIGASVTMSEIGRSSELDFLHKVAASVGGPAVRNMATIGGNLFAPHPYGDLTTALLALDAKVSTAGAGDIDLQTFLSNRSSFHGLVRAIALSKPNNGEFRYKKISRVKPKGISVMSIAAWLPMQGGRVANARLAFGAMGPHPLRAAQAERALEGVTLDLQSIQPALQALLSDLQPFDDPIASAWYRQQVAPVHLRRLLLNEGVR